LIYICIYLLRGLDYLFLPLLNSPVPTNNDIGCIVMNISTPSNQKNHTQSPVKPRIIRWPTVYNKVGMCRSHVHKLVSQGLFPPPIKLSENGRASGWIEAEVDEYLEQRIAESRPNNPEAA
jgi:prophage regulatory protein